MHFQRRVQVSSRGVNYIDFFHSRRVQISKSRGPRQGGGGLNVIAQYHCNSHLKRANLLEYFTFKEQ